MEHQTDKRTWSGFFSIIILYETSLNPPGYIEWLRYLSCNSFCPETFMFLELVTIT